MIVDVLSITTRVAKLLDPIAPELRAKVFSLLADRYQLRTTTGAIRTARYRQRLRDAGVTGPPSHQPSLGDGFGDAIVTHNGVTAVSPGPPSSTPNVGFKIPGSILEALEKTKKLGTAVRLKNPGFWQAEIRANPAVDYAKEILKAEAWIEANHDRAPRKSYSRFLHNWLKNAEREEVSE